jgi:hypothetical protein
MTTVQEIESANEKLTSEDRARLGEEGTDPGAVSAPQAARVKFSRST